LLISLGKKSNESFTDSFEVPFEEQEKYIIQIWNEYGINTSNLYLNERNLLSDIVCDLYCQYCEWEEDGKKEENKFIISLKENLVKLKDFMSKY
jgi:hypothetical protein